MWKTSRQIFEDASFDIYISGIKRELAIEEIWVKKDAEIE
jgi:hypothetical protein